MHGPELFGVDYNPYFVKWCKLNLQFATFERSSLAGRLPFANQTFDFIYAISVFTHFDEEHERFWVDELSRVLTPGGALLLTLHGKPFAKKLAPDQRSSFEAGKMVVARSHLVGTNSCAAFHPSHTFAS